MCYYLEATFFRKREHLSKISFSESLEHIDSNETGW